MATPPNPLLSLATSGLQVPPGALVDATYNTLWYEPLLWYADGPASPGDWAALRDAGRSLGLLPVLIDRGNRDQGPDAWDLDPVCMSYPDEHVAEDVLRELWDPYAEEGSEPENAWPGLAPTPLAEGPDSPEKLAADIADTLTEDGTADARLALVPASRSADIPAAIGWSGPVNHEEDVARLCTVLRSWEDRFGIRVVVLGADTLTVGVARPPTTEAEALALAAEHYAFCPNNIEQSTLDTLEKYATKALLGQEAWTFWWG